MSLLNNTENQFFNTVLSLSQTAVHDVLRICHASFKAIKAIYYYTELIIIVHFPIYLESAVTTLQTTSFTNTLIPIDIHFHPQKSHPFLILNSFATYMPANQVPPKYQLSPVPIYYSFVLH